MKPARLLLSAAIGAAVLGVLMSAWRGSSPPRGDALPASVDLPSEAPDRSRQTNPADPTPPTQAADTSRPTAASTATSELPGSLAGAGIDGGVNLDGNGRLIPDLALRRLFDQLLSLVGERPLDEIRALLATQLDALTTPEGKRQALAAFQRYLKYLGEVDSAAARLAELPLRERLAALSELRLQHLGSEMADAFFGDEEAYQRYTLDRRELAEDTAIGAEERAARERELLAELPPAMREPLLAQQRVEADLADAAAIDSLAADAQERFRLRRERYGEEAAARMELLDRERVAWEARLAAYRAERERVARLDAGTRGRALDEYLARHFSETEQRRIRSLQDIGEL